MTSFRPLDYQDRVLSAIDTYLDCLKEKKARADKIADLALQDPDLNLDIPDFSADTWEALKAQGKLPASRADIPHSPRNDGCERSVPNIVLKVPTGGGKTWLAISGVSRIMGSYLGSNTGFVLWVVPNEAIYTQTLKHLKDRQHPYRQALDRAAAGRVKIMEKSDRLDARDVDEHLCVMLLMLQSANRQTKDTLKMFQDRGDVHGFFPSEGEQQAHEALLESTPNLDGYKDLYSMVKDSLGNALRITRPIVVLDEGHKATSQLAYDTLYGFNPCFVLELTATPQDVKAKGGENPREARYANVLVEVTGKELDDEEMIKMPLNLDSRQGNDWRATLNIALTKLEQIEKAAKELQANQNRYIRPIMLVQVERTGAGQKEKGFIHADDVKKKLLAMGFDEAEIAIKTADQNDLNQPENQDLLSPTNRVRVIITKQALQEGWDCPFAYVLCALAANSNIKAMTQLVGRILRQPGALKTGMNVLDECHVITHRAKTATVVEAVKAGLEQDGLGDMVLQVPQAEGEDVPEGVSGKAKRRPGFKKTEIYLPKVMIASGADVRELDYETDVLSRIEWRGLDPKDIADRISPNAQAAENQLQRITIADDGKGTFVNRTVAKNSETLVFDPAYAVRMTLDLVPNPFVGREIVDGLVRALKKKGFSNKKLGTHASYIVERLRQGLEIKRDELAEAFFKKEVEGGRIQFRLRLDGRNWRMPFDMGVPVESGTPLFNKSREPIQKSLFSPIYQEDMNTDERDVAVYLDADETLTWWHRNVARSQYGLQGWRKHKIYPDFIFALQHDGKVKRTIVLETKGDQLDNLDTDYKRKVLDFLTDHFQWETDTPLGVREIADPVEGKLILMSEWKSELPELLKSTRQNK